MALVVRRTRLAPVHAVAPGDVEVTINGVRVDVHSSWSWDGSFTEVVLRPDRLAEYGVRVKPGDEITVRFTGKAFPVTAWKAEVREGEGTEVRQGEGVDAPLPQEESNAP